MLCNLPGDVYGEKMKKWPSVNMKEGIKIFNIRGGSFDSIEVKGYPGSLGIATIHLGNIGLFLSIISY